MQEEEEITFSRQNYNITYWNYGWSLDKFSKFYTENTTGIVLGIFKICFTKIHVPSSLTINNVGLSTDIMLTIFWSTFGLVPMMFNDVLLIRWHTQNWLTHPSHNNWSVGRHSSTLPLYGCRTLECLEIKNKVLIKAHLLWLARSRWLGNIQWMWIYGCEYNWQKSCQIASSLFND